MKRNKDIHQLAMDLVKVAQDQQKGIICIVIDPERNGASIARTPAQDDAVFHAFQILKHLHPAFCKLVLEGLQDQPQWQTGPIPEPTELAALVLEGPVFGDIKTFSDEHNGEWYWCKALGYSIGIATMMEDPSDFDLTGRWCIIPLTLPASDGIGTTKDANTN